METDFRCGAQRISGLTREMKREPSCSGEQQRISRCSTSARSSVARGRDPVANRQRRTAIARARQLFGAPTHMADEDLKAELERLKAENERLKSYRGRNVSLKVSEKGGLSVYGLGRFPVTLYKEQWTKLLDMADDIRAFLKENDSRLKSKA